MSSNPGTRTYLVAHLLVVLIVFTTEKTENKQKEAWDGYANISLNIIQLVMLYF